MPDPADDDDVILQVVQVVREVLVILRSPRVVLQCLRQALSALFCVSGRSSSPLVFCECL